MRKMRSLVDFPSGLGLRLTADALISLEASARASCEDLLRGDKYSV